MTPEKGKDAEAKESPPPETETPEGRREENERRRFLKLSLAFGLVLAVGGLATVARSLIGPLAPEPGPAPPTTVTETVTVGSSGAASTTTSTSAASSAFPRLMVANVSDLSGGQTVVFDYPLDNTPNVIAKLGTAAEGGVGPDGDIVAFSVVCQHLGCIWGFVPEGGSPKCDSSYKAPGAVGYCCCHGSVYDLLKSGEVVSGPAPRPAPQVTLEFDSSTGDIYAVGMGPPTIFGHDTGSDNVLEDLQGGSLVG
jgi:arsenite oxidase small subunit